MRSFLKSLLFFMFPIAIGIIAFELLLYRNGESLSVQDVLNDQALSADEILFMRGVVSQDYNVYKVAGTKLTSPEVLVIGSSRTMQFRGAQFKEGLRFYNAGGILQNANDLIEFSGMIKQGIITTPSLLICGIDPWWFKKDVSSDQSWLTDESLIDNATDYRRRPYIYIKLLKYFKYNGLNDGDGPNLGLYARTTGAGFRLEGSKSLEPKIIKDYIENPVYIDREQPPVNERIINGLTSRFSVSPVDTVLCIRVLEAIEAISEMVPIVVYLPPFSTESYNLINNSEIHRDWWDYMASEFYPKLDKISDLVIPIECPQDYDLRDDYFIDGFHPSEVFVGIQLEKFSRYSSVLNQYVSTDLSKISSEAALPLVYQIHD